MQNPFPFQSNNLLENGFKFLHQDFLPQLNQLEQSKRAEAFAELTFLSYQLDLPLVAIQFGNDALLLGLQNPIFEELMITLHLETGAYLAALKLSKKAIDAYPDYLDLHHLQQQIQDYLNYNHEPKYDLEHWRIKMDEWLFKKNFEQIEERLRSWSLDQEAQIYFSLRYFAASNQMDAFNQLLTSHAALLEDDFPSNAIDVFYMH